MYKKLISLTLTLALAGMSSAGTYWWNGNVANGDWGVASNWSTSGTVITPSSAVPGAGDQVNAYPINGSVTNATITVSSNQTMSRMLGTMNTTTLNILANATLTNDGAIGSTRIYNDSGYTINIDGTFNNASTFQFGGGGTNVININQATGILRVSNAVHNASFQVGTTGTTGGSAYVNVYGLLEVDAYSFGSLANEGIIIHEGGGMKIAGNVANQVYADMAAGKIAVNIDGFTYSWFPVDTTGVPGYTTIIIPIIPEPATLLLLGLGGLRLRKRIQK